MWMYKRFVMPAQAGIQWRRIPQTIEAKWIPAFAGMTCLVFCCLNHPKIHRLCNGHTANHHTRSDGSRYNVTKNPRRDLSKLDCPFQSN